MLVGALAVLAVTGVLASSHRLVIGERPVFEAVNGLPGWLLWPVRGIMVFGTTGGALAVVALVGAGALLGSGGSDAPALRRWSALAPMLVSLATTVVVGKVAFEVLKRVVDRNRPGRFLAALPHLHARDQASGLGFPSGHATTSMALALTLSAWWPRSRWPLVALAVLVALGRLYVGVHLPLDVVGGMALGVLVSAVATGVGRSLTGAASRTQPPQRDVTH